MNRRGPYIVTHSGRQVWAFDLRPEDIDFNDVAYSLARQNRYAGHAALPVGLHSIACADVARILFPSEPILWLCALYHDGPEAYLQDIVGPHKKWLAQFTSEYDAAEQRAWEAFAELLRVPKDLPEEVKMIDADVYLAECRYLGRPCRQDEYRGPIDITEPVHDLLDLYGCEPHPITVQDDFLDEHDGIELDSKAFGRVDSAWHHPLYTGTSR